MDGAHCFCWSFNDFCIGDFEIENVNDGLGSQSRNEPV